MATLSTSIKIDPLSIKPVPCPDCGKIIGQQVTINGESWLELTLPTFDGEGKVMSTHTAYIPYLPFMVHDCGEIVYFGKKKGRR